MAKTYLRKLRMVSVPLKLSDVFAFVLWCEELISDLENAESLGCFTVVGAGALEDPNIKFANVVIGSYSDSSKSINPSYQLNKFDLIVLTNGMNGSIAYFKGGQIRQAAFEVAIVDATGAGDTFIAGFLAGIANEVAITEALEIAAKWTASAAQVKSSVPPAFDPVKQERRVE